MPAVRLERLRCGTPSLGGAVPLIMINPHELFKPLPLTRHYCRGVLILLETGHGVGIVREQAWETGRFFPWDGPSVPTIRLSSSRAVHCFIKPNFAR